MNASSEARRSHTARFIAWLPRSWLGRNPALALSLAGLLSGLLTYAIFTRSESPFGPRSGSLSLLISLNLTILLALVSVIALRVMALWRALRTHSAGSRLQTRIVALFSLVTIIPTLMVSAFSAVFFNIGIQSWFNERVSTGLEESVAVAEAYLEEHKEVIRADALAMGRDLNRELPSALHNPTFFQQLLSTQAALRSLSEAVVIHRNRIIARTMLSFSLAFEPLPEDTINRAEEGEVVIFTDDEDRVRALLKLDALPDTYLLVGRLVDSKVLDHMVRAKGAVSEYSRLQQQIYTLQIQFSLVYVLVALVLLLAVIWYGLHFASRLMIPINRLITAAERVRGGDYSARVSVSKRGDELSMLGRAFNRMTERLEAQRQDLIEANRELDERRRFIEAVLGGVSAGVIALDKEKNITLCNRSAVSLLMQPSEETVRAQSVTAVLPGIEKLLQEGEASPQSLIQYNLTLTVRDRSLTLQVKVTVERYHDEIEGFIITFDDISELQAAQRTAAWADVARRVAHEIKNPLTPIQLSAERLRKKYLPQITQDAENYLKYTDTISKHVSDIGKMVEEFVAFARMPNPTFAKENLVSIIRKAAFSQQTAYPDIEVKLELPDQPVWVECDERLLTQVFTNLLKNAAEAIEGRDKKNTAPQGKIILRLSETDGRAHVEIRDNGPGFPPGPIHQFMEPYVTTRPKGTGLGLAIVKKILDDHRARLTLENQPEGGALVKISLSLMLENPQ